MKKKLCSILLALTMVLTLLPVSALAEGGAALPEEDANGVITLTENVTIEKWAVTKDATLNLNGFSYTTSDCGVDISNGATLTIVDTGKNGKLTSAGTPICVAGANSKVVINSGTVESTNNYGIYAKDGGTAIVNGGTVHSNYAALSGNNTTGNMSFEINGGTLTANNGPAIYMPGQVTLKITGGILNGGISLRMGQVTISGGTINATTNTATIDAPTSTVDGHPAYAYSGNVWFADALYVFGGTYPNGDDQYGNSLNLTISGGTFNCTNDQGSAVAIYDLGKVAQTANVTIIGGTFTTATTTRNAYQVVSLADIGATDPEAGYGNPEFVGKVNSTISGGTFSDLNSAIAYAADGATIKLAKNIASDIVIPADKAITLDLNGHNLTNVSGHTITNNGTLVVTGNGTVDNISHGKAALYNNTGATATLNGGTFTRSAEAGTASSNSANGNSWYTVKNYGTMTINSNTTITNTGSHSSAIANGWYDASKAGSNGEPTCTADAVLTINGGNISGGKITVKNDDYGTLSITGGTFTQPTNGLYCIYNANVTSISGGTVNGAVGSSNSSVEGDLGKLDITGGTYTDDPTDYVASTAIARKDGDAQYTVVAKANLTSGVYMSNPADFLAPGYVSYKNSDDTYTVYYPVPVIPNNNNNSSSTTTKNPDGSTTTTTTDKATGAVTETTTTANGSVGTVKTAANGSTEISASISAADVKAAEQKNAPVIAPITVTPAASSAAAPVIKLSVPANAGEVAVAIPVVNAKQGTVAVRVNPDGTEEIIKTAVITENGLVLGVKGSMQIKVINNSKNFADTVGHWAASDVDFVSARELFNGTAPALFSPEASMTRGMVVTVIARLAGENTDGGANWYDKGCAWAVANGVSDGTDPNGSITREQLAAMLYRYCGSPAASGGLSTYADAASVSAFASDAMQWCVNNGIINGMDGLLNPQGQATRAQVSAMFARYIRMAAAK